MAFWPELQKVATGRGGSILAVCITALLSAQAHAEFAQEGAPLGKSLPVTLLDGPSADKIGLRRWLTDLKIDVPGGSSMEMPGMGDLEVRGGTCRGLTVDTVVLEDNSSDLVLEFDVQLKGMGIQCSLEGWSNGTVYLNITVAGSGINATVQMHPLYSELAPDLPMPFGELNMTSCVPSLAITDASFTGTADVVKLVSGIPKSDLLNAMQSFAEVKVCDAVKELIERNGTAGVATGASFVAPMLMPPLVLPEPKVLRPPMDWASWPPIAVLQALVRERFSIWVGRVVEILKIHDFSARLVKTENVSLDLRQLHIEGVGPQHRPGLELVAENETLGFVADLPGLVLDAVLVLSVFLPEQPILTEVIQVRLGLNNVTLLTRSIVDDGSLDDLNPEQLAASPKCLVSCTDGMTDPRTDAISVTEIGANIRPLLEIAAYGDIEKDITHLVNVVLRALFHGYMPTVNALAKGGLGLARMPVDSLLWSKIDALAPCDLRATSLAGVDQDAVNLLPKVAVGILLAGAITSVAAIIFAGTRKPSEHAGAEADMTSNNIALAREPVVPLAIRVFYPFAILTVMCIFFFADFGLGAVVEVVFAADGKTSMIGPVFSFSLISTIADAWTSGSWAISVLTLVMSGLWPHIKLLMLLAAWVLPPHHMSMKARGRVLAFLDTWGKYGFLESWFLVFSISAFAVEWQSVSEGRSIQVVTHPRSAFWAFFIATVLSLLLGHTASEYNSYAIRRRAKAILARRKAAAAASAEVAPGAEQQPSTASPAAQPPSRQSPSDLSSATASTNATSIESYPDEAEGHKAHKTAKDYSHDYSPLQKHVSRKSRLGVLCGLALSVVLVVFGSFVTSFDFGISGVFIEFLLSKPVDKSYSLMSVGGSIASGRYASAGLPVLEIMFFLLVIVIPLTLLTALVALWMVPLSVKNQRCLLHACRVLDAWACLDVAALVLLIAIMQFGMMAEFLASRGSLGAPCKMIKNMTQEECFAIKMSAHAGVAPLLLAGVALLIVPKVAMRLSEIAIAHKKAGPTTLETGPVRECPCAETAARA